MTLLGIKNDRATVAAPCQPWLFEPQVPVCKDKAEYLRWRATETTEHLLFFATEGLNQSLRPNKKTNPVQKMRGLVVDFDFNILPIMVEEGLKSAPPGLRPNWITKTYSNGRRLVYEFEEPIAFADELARPFFNIVEAALHLRKVLPGLDETWANAYRIFDVGTDWERLSDKPIATNVLHHWLFQAAKNVKFKAGEVNIPIDEVAAEIERQYPGTTDGLQIGARCSVFWDGGQNPSSCIIAENGVICFSREKPFYTWADVLGNAFVAKYTADKIGGAVRNVYWDGRGYYCKDGDVWWPYTTESIRRALTVDYKLEDNKARHATSSEVDQALRYIEKHRRVAGAVPIVFNREEIVWINGMKFLNTSHIKPVEPHPIAQEWRENFPFIASFLEARFLSEEYPYLMGWLQRAYMAALTGVPSQGQALFLVGAVQSGKTLFSNKIVGGMLGGFADASSHIAKGSEFNKELGEVGLLCIDDGEVAANQQAHRRFSEVVKKVVANPTFTWRAMRRDPQTIPLNARLIITLNDDPYSVEMIPDLAHSMEEKVMVLKFHDAPFEFAANHVQEAVIAGELPFFCRYVMDWKMPAEIVGTHRFGVKHFINEDLRAKSLHAGGVGDLLEIIDLHISRSTIRDQYGASWETTASEWLSVVGSDPDLRPLVSKFSPRVLGKRFSEASRITDSGITVSDGNGKRGNRYCISLQREEVRKTVRFTPEVAVA